TTDTASVTVTDTIDTTIVTLDDVTVDEAGEVIYTASVDNPPQGAFTVTLNNGVDIVFADGALTGASAAQQVDLNTVQEDFVVSVVSTTGGNYEALNIDDTAWVEVPQPEHCPEPEPYYPVDDEYDSDEAEYDDDDYSESPDDYSPEYPEPSADYTPEYSEAPDEYAPEYPEPSDDYDNPESTHHGEMLFGTHGDDYMEDSEGTQYVIGYEGKDTFVIKGSIVDYGVDKTDDGGVVIWQDEKFDIVYDVEYVLFDDGGYEVDESGSPLIMEGSYQKGMAIKGSNGDDHMENPDDHQYFFGGDGIDTVSYKGQSSDYETSKTDDGGYVIWTESGDFDILYDVEYAEFEDEVLELE
ncbi:MAG: immunoglobulin-like domain-containing protein, partial [Rhizobiaceae bacterium]